LASLALAGQASASVCPSFLLNMRQNADLQRIRSQFDPNHFYWQFPSDHLPVVGDVKLRQTGERFRILTWNVLNQTYIDFIINGTQGLKVSEITTVADRKERVLQILRELNAEIGPAVIALQEVDSELAAALADWALARQFELRLTENPSRGRNGEIVDFGAVLFNSRRLTEVPELRGLAHFSDSSKYIQRFGFQTRRGATFLFTNVNRAYRDNETLQKYFLYPFFHPSIIVGDFNWNLPSIKRELAAIPGLSIMKIMKKASGDFSHIDTERKLSDYDHILYSGRVTVQSRAEWNLKARRHFRITKSAP
jgi:endonuclease/exonuclease/phosphatase family metal-dependent hydrolase